MLELLIDKLVLEGKITREEIDESIEKLKTKPPVGDEIDTIKYRQESTEEMVLFILDSTLTRGGDK